MEKHRVGLKCVIVAGNTLEYEPLQAKSEHTLDETVRLLVKMCEEHLDAYAPWPVTVEGEEKRKRARE